MTDLTDLNLRKVANGGWVVTKRPEYNGLMGEEIGAFSDTAAMLRFLHDKLGDQGPPDHFWTGKVGDPCKFCGKYAGEHGMPETVR